MRVWHSKNNYKISCILSGRSNVFLVSGSGKNILIDTSPGYKWGQLKSKLEALRIKAIDYLILTHTHFDHAGNAANIKNQFGATVIVNKREAGYLEKGTNTMVYGTVSILRGLVRTIAPTVMAKQRYEPCQPDILVDKYLDMDNFDFKGYILHTPGHSPGSQSIIIDDEIALTGDAMFGIFPGSILPPFAENEVELIKSWGLLLDSNSRLFLPSHGSANSRQLVEKGFNKRRSIIRECTSPHT